MVEQEWMKFASTGSIQDYLSYKGRQESEGLYGDATGSLLAGGNGIDRSVTGYGADHNADRYGTVGSPGGGI